DPDQVMVNTGNGAMKFRNHTIRDAHRGGFGTITASQVLEKSSNIGIVQLMQRYFANKPDKYLGYLKQFHLTQPTGIHMKGEKPPLIRDRKSKQWSSYSMYFMAHGYEMQMTPLQTLAFYNAVANNGYWVRPMIVREIRNAEEIEDKIPPYVEEKPIASPETIRKVKKMLEGVVNAGLAKTIKSDLYQIAGKTGTARKLINGIYTEGKNYTSFAGYFPAEKPKYSCIVIIDNPKSSGADYTRYAGSVAAPVFKEVADRIYAYDVAIQKPVKDSIPEKSEDVKWAGTISDLNAISKTLNMTPAPADSEYATASLYKKGKTKWNPREVDSRDVPDLQGMSMRDALYLMENKGFRVTFRGSGKVIEQSLPPGTNKSGSKTILLTLQ
ncbi:MAG: penicillin-binding transpeptidase domain-containing protein, partial [Dyadobacter fermentans]